MQQPVLGVIEGFYGRPWPRKSRLAMLEWLPGLGLDAYLYAPKADAYLRRAWRDRWPGAQRRLLGELALAGVDAGVDVSVGLSPFALYRAYDRPARRALRDRVQEIIDTGIAGVALLFDDMPGDVDSLAERQAEITHDVFDWLGGCRLRLCPTYYSEDTVLDRVFGPRPEGYLEGLGRAIPEAVALFWTGPAVCSDAIDRDKLQSVARRSGRPVALWDNYPVNDSRTRSEHLYLHPLARRETDSMLESHWCNAMNQAALSLPALASLGELYGRARPSARDAVLAAAGLHSELIDACRLLATRARGSLAQSERKMLEAAAQGAGLAGEELSDWLNGAYVFDPACLTD